MFIAWIMKYICIDVSEDQFLENLGAESTVSSERQDALDFGAGSVTPCSIDRRAPMKLMVALTLPIRSIFPWGF